MQLHKGQQKVLDDKSSRKLVIVGARWGKSTLAIEMALRRCQEKKRTIRLYEHNRQMVQWCMHYAYEYMERKSQKFTHDSRGRITFPNGSELFIDTYPIFGDEELIFDDAFDRASAIAIMFTPWGWTKHQAPSTENPLVNVDEYRKSYDPEYFNSMFKGLFPWEDENESL